MVRLRRKIYAGLGRVLTICARLVETYRRFLRARGGPLNARFVTKAFFKLYQKDTQGFYTYAVEWTPCVVRHYVDDVLVAERPYQWRHDGGPVHVLTSLVVGGNWPGDPASAAVDDPVYPSLAKVPRSSLRLYCTRPDRRVLGRLDPHFSNAA
jgi:hypothetical protein